MSHQIKELEDTLVVRLFERKTRAIELTAAGYTLLNEVEPLLEALDRSLTQIARHSSRTTLRVQMPPFFANELFVPRLLSFCQTHPNIDIQLDTHELRPIKHQPTADVSILLADSVPQGLQVERLFPVSLTAVCAKEHLAAVARLGRDVFHEMSLIVHKARPQAWGQWAEEVGIEAPEPKNTIELDTLFAVVRAAERGIGLALVPGALCHSWFQSGALVPIFSVELATRDSYFLVSRMRDAEKPEVAALTRWMLDEFRAFDERAAR